MFNQDDKTKKFVEQVKTLVNKGIEPTYKAIAEKVGWHNNSLSVTMKGGRNVPFDVYKKFLEIYKLEEESLPENDSDYKAKYVAMLERQVKEQARQLSELKDRMDSRTLQITDQTEKIQANLATMLLNQKSLLSYARTLYAAMIEHRAALEEDNLKTVKSKMDKLLADHFAQISETDSQ